METISFEELIAEGYKKWHQFPFPYSLKVMYGRLNNRRPRPVFRATMMWQRARRGWSEEDTWGFDMYLSEVIAGGVGHLRENLHGWPGEPMTFEEWGQILDEIVTGMRASIRLRNGGPEGWEKNVDFATIPKLVEDEQRWWDEIGEAEFNLAMDHLKKYFFNLWD